MKLFLIALAALSTCIFSGCDTVDKDNTSIPWSRPASWEGQAPGMGSLAPGGGR